MARYAIGDVQGCYDELRVLLQRIGFSADRDRLWFVGDLVNRGPKSLEVLNYVHALGENALVVLGNHGLHLLVLAYASARKRKSGDTLDALLDSKHRDKLLEWLMSRPLAHFDAEHGDLMVHAGLIPQWDTDDVLALSSEVAEAIRADARQVFDEMYGNEPRCWSDGLRGSQRLRFAVNALTRLRVCTAEGCIDMEMKGKPEDARAPFRAWFEHENRRSAAVRVIFGHWSAAGYINTGMLVGLDTGCVWGNQLTALNLDTGDPPLSVPCAGRPSV